MATENLVIGSVAPAFDLKGVDGKNYKLEDLNNKKGIVVVFACNHCPYVQAYEERIMEIQKEYADKLNVAAINSNFDGDYPEDSYEKMIERSKEKNFNYVYLRDEDQSVAKAFGATHTPEIFLFDEDLTLRYHGKIDDNWKEPESVRTKYLRDAIDEMLTGDEISIPETFSIGCTIKWKQ